MNKIAVVSTTLNDRQLALEIAEALVRQRFAACVQVSGPIESVYQWQGQLCCETEFKISCKTLPDRFDLLREKLMEIHPYDLPEVLVEELETTEQYRQWLSEQIG